MKRSILLIVAMAMLALGSCAAEISRSANKKTVTRNVKTAPFTSISMYGSMDVHYTQGNTTKIKVQTDETTMKYLEVKSDGKKLVIKLKSPTWRMFGSGDIDIYITSPDLTGVSISGSGDFEAERRVDTDDMTISIAGSGDVDFNDLICNSVKTSIKGSGDVEIDRLNTAKAKFSIAGSGDISVKNANIAYAKCSIAGSGDISLRGKIKSLDEDVAGSGTVSINGDDDD